MKTRVFLLGLTVAFMAWRLVVESIALWREW